MKRRSFFATVAALFVAPKVLESKPKFEEIQKNVFDVGKLQGRLDQIRKYPLTEKEAFRRPLISNGTLKIQNNFVSIITDKHDCRIGDFITTIHGDQFYVINVGHFIVNSIEGEDIGKDYIHCDPVAIKTICNHQVFTVNGKYVLYKISPRRQYDVTFIRSGTAFSEGGVRNA